MSYEKDNRWRRMWEYYEQGISLEATIKFSSFKPGEVRNAYVQFDKEGKPINLPPRRYLQNRLKERWRKAKEWDKNQKGAEQTTLPLDEEKKKELEQQLDKLEEYSEKELEIAEKQLLKVTIDLAVERENKARKKLTKAVRRLAKAEHRKADALEKIAERFKRT